MDVKTSTNEFQIFSEAESVLIMRDRTTAISAVDLEIRWFKETDCVCFYKNKCFIEGMNYKDKVDLPKEELERGNILLHLKNINESDFGDYLCQVTCEDRIEEINISLKEAPGTEKQTSSWKPNDKQWKDNERMNMKESALLAVFHNLQKVLQTDRQGDEAAKNLDKQQQGCPEKRKGPQTDRQGDDGQNEAGGNHDSQQPGSPENKDYHKKDNKTEISPSKPEDKDNMDSTQSECAGQGQSQSSNKSHKDTKKSQQLQEKKLKREKQGATVFSIFAIKINDIHKKFIVDLKTRIENLTEAQRVEDSDVVLIFCPIVSRAGTDIDAALTKIQYSTDSKLTVLVVLHHTFDSEKTISNSSKYVNRENLLTVDCLFYEDTGLLDCQRNSDAYNKSASWLIAQGHKIGVNISPRQSETSKKLCNKLSRTTKQEGTLQKIDNKQQMTSTFSSEVKIFMNVTGDAQEHPEDFIKALEKQMSLRMVQTVEDSDVILLFCSSGVIGNKKTGKPVVLILFDRTMVPESDFSKRFLTVLCPVPEGKGLLDCQMNKKNISDVSTFLKG